MSGREIHPKDFNLDMVHLVESGAIGGGSRGGRESAAVEQRGMADTVRHGDGTPAAPDHASSAETLRLQRGALSCWPGENTANVKIGELHAVLNHDQAEWLHDRLGECLMEMKKKAAPATDIGRAASAAAKSRGW